MPLIVMFPAPDDQFVRNVVGVIDVGDDNVAFRHLFNPTACHEPESEVIFIVLSPKPDSILI